MLHIPLFNTMPQQNPQIQDPTKSIILSVCLCSSLSLSVCACLHKTKLPIYSPEGNPAHHIGLKHTSEFCLQFIHK